MVGVLAFAVAARAADGLPPAVVQGVRWSERLDSSDGLPASNVGNVEQDARGFLWVGTLGGVARYDGARVVPVSGPGSTLVPGPSPLRRLVVQLDGGLWAVGDDGLTALPAPPEPILAARLDGTGQVWFRSDHRLYRESPGAWKAVDGPWGDDAWPIGSLGDELVVSTSTGDLYRVGDRAERIGALPNAIQAETWGTDLVVIGNASALNDHGVVTALRGGATAVLYQSDQRVIGMASDADRLFVAYDRSLVELGRDGRTTVRPTADCCGQPLVDTDGGLWIGTSSGVRHYPSPDAATFEGPATFRGVATADGFWTATWSGVFYLRADGIDATRTGSGTGAMRVCLDADGQAWGAIADRILRFHPDGSLDALPGAGQGAVHACGPGSDRRTWLVGWHRLLVSDPTDPVP
ncbi:MAG: two-component regulator propeller domain-containing protein, partial [Myxococcota bacterium]